LKVFLYANGISTVNAYSIMYGETVSCSCLLYWNVWHCVLVYCVCNCMWTVWRWL